MRLPHWQNPEEARLHSHDQTRVFCIGVKRLNRETAESGPKFGTLYEEAFFGGEASFSSGMVSLHAATLWAWQETCCPCYSLARHSRHDPDVPRNRSRTLSLRLQRQYRAT